MRRATTVPAREVMVLLDQVVLSFLVGNHDAHGKNFSLLYRTRLAPGWDAPVLGRIEEIVAQRAAWLLEISRG